MSFPEQIWPVSYTHLDVYKRQSLDSVSDEAEDFELSAELISPKPENLAYMIYTSGSTGKHR